MGPVKETRTEEDRKTSEQNHGRGMDSAEEEGCIIGKIAVKEYGASAALAMPGQGSYKKLKEFFSEDADMIFTLAVLRITEKCPFKQAGFLYEQSCLSERFPGLAVSP